MQHEINFLHVCLTKIRISLVHIGLLNLPYIPYMMVMMTTPKMMSKTTTMIMMMMKFWYHQCPSGDYNDDDDDVRVSPVPIWWLQLSLPYHPHRP